MFLFNQIFSQNTHSTLKPGSTPMEDFNSYEREVICERTSGCIFPTVSEILGREDPNVFEISKWKKLTIIDADGETQALCEMTNMSKNLYCIRLPLTDDCINLFLSDDFGPSKMVQVVFTTTDRFTVGSRCILTQKTLICF